MQVMQEKKAGRKLIAAVIAAALLVCVFPTVAYADNDKISELEEKIKQTQEEKEETVVLHISRDPAEKEKAESEAAKSSDDDESQEDTETDSEEEITAYLRVGESKIIYKISGLDYEDLMEDSYNDLRHQEVIWADFEDISGVRISLEGAEYELTVEKKKEGNIWYYEDNEIETDDFRNAFNSLSASEFTEEEPTDKEEISLTLQIDSVLFLKV